MNAYSGFCVPARDWQCDRIAADSVTPRQFFERYVATRTPVVLTGSPDPRWRGALWDNEYLARKAGQCEVRVEHRESAAAAYGLGSTTRMPFATLLARLSAGTSTLYMTTQPIEEDGFGPKNLHGPPLTALRDDFPDLPALLGCLAPYQHNMWMGHAPDGSSSGLHHDFHDNVYVLLRGRKRFTLFSPADAELMYTRGAPVKVHPNGVINYGEVTRADGAHPALLRRCRQRKAELELERAEEALQRAVATAAAEAQLEPLRQRVAAADRALEEALEDMMDSEDGSEDWDALEDSADHEGGDSGARAPPRAAAGAGSDPAPAPDHFSRVPVPALRAFVRNGTVPKQFPLLRRATPAEVELRAGDMLFLPAGWFHEVQSYGGGAQGHLAFNFWAHPPARADFELPYEDDYFRDCLALRGAAEAGTEAPQPPAPEEGAAAATGVASHADMAVVAPAEEAVGNAPRAATAAAAGAAVAGSKRAGAGAGAGKGGEPRKKRRGQQ